MSREVYLNWVLPLGITAVGCLYGLWGAWVYERNARRRERRRAGGVAPPVAE